MLSSSCQSNLRLHAEHVSDLLHGSKDLSGCSLAVGLNDASVTCRIFQSKSDDLFRDGLEAGAEELDEWPLSQNLSSPVILPFHHFILYWLF